MHSQLYPFVAIVGQEKVKRGLILNLIEPRIGGILLCGEKGCAKSTIVRALGALSGVKIVDLPLNTTEDMLIGSLDFETAVRDGRRAFSGGLLERADGNILYVDEVNLLPAVVYSTIRDSSSAWWWPNPPRDLVLDTAISHVEYTHKGVRHKREYFTSYPRRVLRRSWRGCAWTPSDCKVGRTQTISYPW